MITSPHNQKLKEIRRLAGAAGATSRALRRRGRGPAGRRRRGGLAARGRLRRGRQRARRHGGRARGAGRASRRSARARARSPSTRSAGRAPAGPLCVCLWGVGDPGNVGTVAARRARLRRRRRRARARAAPTRSARRPCGRRMGAIFEVPLARVAAVAELPGAAIALVARAGEPLRGPARRATVTLLVGAERDGLPADVVAALRRGRPHPDRDGVAERRDGGDRRALRDD